MRVRPDETRVRQKCFAPASSNSDLDLNTVHVFYVPRGTFVALRPGVWHHAPFVVNNPVVHVLIVLPERTYANDCTVVELAVADGIGRSKA